MPPGLQPSVPDGHRAWRRWTVHLQPEQLAPPGLQGLQKRERVQPEPQQLVLPGLRELRGPEQVLRVVCRPTGQAPWARLPELRS